MTPLSPLEDGALLVAGTPQHQRPCRAPGARADAERTGIDAIGPRADGSITVPAAEYLEPYLEEKGGRLTTSRQLRHQRQHR